MSDTETELLRLTTAGSVDDGKSTLIGRLLLDTGSVPEDQLEAVERASRRRGGGGVDLSLLTDGLRAEREQGITIDVAYRYFATPRRKFIIADTPGHVQYTRNMVTGASTADLAVVLVDAGRGVLPQSRRHGFIASLLGIPHVVVAVNKMDTVDWDARTFDGIVAEYRDFAQRLEIGSLSFVPVLRAPWRQRGAPEHAHAVVRRAHAPHHLENVHLGRGAQPSRLPLPHPVRDRAGGRGLAGARGVRAPSRRARRWRSFPPAPLSRVRSVGRPSTAAWPTRRGATRWW
jgi:bifunctional enzyme CysN/CysC